MMDFLLPSLHAAVNKHGSGLILAILDGVSRAHAVHLETATHGIFVKAHFPNPKNYNSSAPGPSRSTTQSPSMCTTSSAPPSPVSSPQISRTQFLQCRMQQLDLDHGVKNTFIHFDTRDIEELKSAQSAPASIGRGVASHAHHEGLEQNRGRVTGADEFAIHTPRETSCTRRWSAALRIQRVFRGAFARRQVAMMKCGHAWHRVASWFLKKKRRDTATMEHLMWMMNDMLEKQRQFRESMTSCADLRPG